MNVQKQKMIKTNTSIKNILLYLAKNCNANAFLTNEDNNNHVLEDNNLVLEMQ